MEALRQYLRVGLHLLQVYVLQDREGNDRPLQHQREEDDVHGAAGVGEGPAPSRIRGSTTNTMWSLW